MPNIAGRDGNDTLIYLESSKKCAGSLSFPLLRSSGKKCVLKNLANFTEKHLCCSLILTKLQQISPPTLLNLGPNIDVFL